MHLFLSALGSRLHVHGVFCRQKRNFSETLSRVDLFENAVFMLSCGPVNTELIENVDVAASIYDVSKLTRGSLGITQGHFDCLVSFIEVRTAKFESSGVFAWARIFYIRIKKDMFSKMSGYGWTRPEPTIKRC